MSSRELDAAGITDPALRASYEACRRLNAAHGKTYYLATLLLPAWKRPYVHALYGFARYADEIVDDLGSTLTDAEKADWLIGWGEQFVRDVEAGGSEHEISRAVVDTVRRWDIPMAHVEAFLASMRMDLTVTEYETYDDLMAYVHGSAAVIGLEMVPVLEPVVPREVAEPYAADLGVAFQMSNFIRDVGEDLRRGRVYLPQEELRGVRRHPRAPRARRGRRARPPAARLRGRPDPGDLPQRGLRACGCCTRPAGRASRPRSRCTAGSWTRSRRPTSPCSASGCRSGPARRARVAPCPGWCGAWRARQQS